MEIYNGRPENTEGRLPRDKKFKTRELLGQINSARLLIDEGGTGRRVYWRRPRGVNKL